MHSGAGKCTGYLFINKAYLANQLNLEDLIMSKKNKKSQPILHEGHQLKTRRDFLAHGYINMSCLAAMPSLYSLLASKRAYGSTPECGGGGGNRSDRPVPFIVIDLAGGANIPGSNVIVGKRNGQLDFLANYTSLGLPNDMHPSNSGQINSELGIAFHQDSGLLRGILATSQASTRANVDGALFCTSSADDTGNNPHNPMYWINKAGTDGALANLLGSRGSVSGGRAQAPANSINPAARPVQISRPQDALGLVDLGKLANILDKDRAEMIMKTIERMSDSKLRQFQQQALPDQIRGLIQCGYVQSAALINQYSEDAVDPRADADVQAVFTNLNNADEARAASISKLVIDGLAGAGTIELGGYDYHGGARARGEIADLRAGRIIGQVLELAARKNSDLMVYVFTDGGVVSNGRIDNSANGRGKGEWTGDSGQRSGALTLVYKTDGRPPIRNSGRQVGAYRDNGAVDSEVNRISGSVTNLTKAVVLNYLALHGREGDLEKVVGDNPFGTNLDEYIAFTKIKG